MRQLRLRNKWLRRVAIAVAIPLAWAAFVYVIGLPFRTVASRACRVCREWRSTDYWFLLIPVRTSIKTNEFSLFYRVNADPDHRHVWAGYGVAHYTRTGSQSGHATPGALRLPFGAALVILKSLPDSATRRAFFAELQAADRHLASSDAEYDRVLKAIYALNEAYYEDKHRTDWVEQIRKVGLYPKVGAKHPTR